MINKKGRTYIMRIYDKFYINGGEANLEAPFGGYKESGNGREFGESGMHEYCEIKAMQF